MTTSIEWLQLFVIPEETSSPEAQIATLKHTLCRLNMLTEEMKLIVSSGMLKYMRYLDSPEKAHLKEYILGELTETELEGLLSLVESASEQLKKQELEKSATPYRVGKSTYGGSYPDPLPKAWVDEIRKGITGSNKLLEALKDKK